MPTEAPSPDALYRLTASCRCSGLSGPLGSSLFLSGGLMPGGGGGRGRSHCGSSLASIHSPWTRRADSMMSPRKTFAISLVRRTAFWGTDWDTVELISCSIQS